MYVIFRHVLCVLNTFMWLSMMQLRLLFVFWFKINYITGKFNKAFGDLGKKMNHKFKNAYKIKSISSSKYPQGRKKREETEENINPMISTKGAIILL